MGWATLSRVRIVPISFRDACSFIKEHHRRHVPPVGHKFSIGLASSQRIVGVLIAGRPVSRQRWKPERLLHALRRAARRIAKGMRYHRVVSYTLADKSGVSLKASGWRLVM